MDNYNPLPTEKKWQEIFEKNKIFKTKSRINKNISFTVSHIKKKAFVLNIICI